MLRKLLALVAFTAVVGNAQTITSVNMLKFVDMTGRTLPTLADGMYWRVNDTLFMRNNGVTTRYPLWDPGDGQVQVWDSAARAFTWGNAGGGGTFRLNEILNPNGHTSMNTGTYMTYFETGQTDANQPSFWWAGSDNLATGYVGLFSTTQAFGMRRPWGAFARGTTNGVYVDSLGNMKYSGAATISANLWKGSSTIDKASQYAGTAYQDGYNTFTGFNQFQKDTSTYSVLFNNNFNSSTAMAAIFNANYGRGLQAQSLYGIGLYGKSVFGPGGAIGSLQGNMLELWFGASYTTRLTFNNAAIIPESGMDLGTFSKPFDSLYVTNFVDVGTKSGTAIFGANDTAFVYGISGLDSNFVVIVNFVDRPLMVAALGAKAYQDGHIEITSSSSPMNGIKVQYIARRKSQ